MQWIQRDDGSLRAINAGNFLICSVSVFYQTFDITLVVILERGLPITLNDILPFVEYRINIQI